ncbi:MAG: tripartite tricarboxylate transporter substrate binding protein [Desulfocucumaceae bacterium]
MAGLCNFKRITILILTLALLLTMAGCGGTDSKPQQAKTPDWPTQDITLIVPYAAGGGYDVVARATAPYIQKHLPKKVNVVVKNVPGAGGKIGLMEMVKSKTDGQNIAVIDPADIAILQVGGQLEGVDLKKLTWLGRLDKLPDLLAVSAKSGIKKPEDMKGKTVRLASIGSGVAFRTAVVGKALGADVKFISYDGTSPASVATAQGDLDGFMVNWSSVIRAAQSNEGKIIPLFVAGNERVPQIKDVPCSKDLGVNLDDSVLGYSHILVAPAGLSPEIKKMWEDTITKVFNDQEWKDQMDKAKYPPAPLSGDKLTAEVNKTLDGAEKFKDIITALLK